MVLAMCLAILPLSKMYGKGGSERTVYIFGYGLSFRDSTAYLSAITTLPASAINSKTKFLKDRDNYSAQVKKYIENAGVKHVTCAVFFTTSKKRAEKKYAKVRKQILRDRQTQLLDIPEEAFAFKLVEPEPQE